MSQGKPNVIKDFEKLDPKIQEQVKLSFPHGFSQHLVTFNNMEGKEVSALPFETEDRNYLIRMTINQAVEIVESDEDYNQDGVLKGKVKEEYSDKYPETEALADHDLIDEDVISDDY